MPYEGALRTLEARKVKSQSGYDLNDREKLHSFCNAWEGV